LVQPNETGSEFLADRLIVQAIDHASMVSITVVRIDSTTECDGILGAGGSATGDAVKSAGQLIGGVNTWKMKKKVLR
jgi:hypothetical protein